LFVSIFIGFSTRISLNGSMFKFIFVQCDRIDTISINNSCIPFKYTDTSCTMSSEITCRMMTYITETLVEKQNYRSLLFVMTFLFLLEQ
jgi:hypothetical protein